MISGVFLDAFSIFFRITRAIENATKYIKSFYRFSFDFGSNLGANLGARGGLRVVREVVESASGASRDVLETMFGFLGPLVFILGRFLFASSLIFDGFGGTVSANAGNLFAYLCVCLLCFRRAPGTVAGRPEAIGYICTYMRERVYVCKK